MKQKSLLLKNKEVSSKEVKICFCFVLVCDYNMTEPFLTIIIITLFS